MAGPPGEISLMPQLFTVRWPLFARLEAVLFFPVALRLASETEPVRTLVDQRLVPALSPFGDTLGLPSQVIFWAAVTIAGIVPYVFVLLVADRFLTVRKGFVLLSAVAISVWAFAALQLSYLLIDFVPDSMLAGTDWLSFDQEAALAAGGLALLLHLRALWTGLRDHGDVADRLIAARDALSIRRESQTQHAQDVYFQQTADFRGWQTQRQLEGLGAGPRENPAVKVLYAITWIGVIVGVGTAYLTWSRHTGLGRAKHETAPDVAAGPARAGAGAKPGAPVPTPAAQAAPALPLANMHAVSAAPLPAVQRPSELSASVQAGSAISGPNEAVSERGNDGGFAFDAVVNGSHVRMLFDTGASVVGLRAEDAARLGIPVTRLNYSVKIKTANGTADVAPVTLDTMVIGNITLRNVPGFVAKQGMLHENLLGQTFLARLSGFNVEKNLLVLKGR
jgi:clan AA aspartic protease (TIGR02281 family)